MAVTMVVISTEAKCDGEICRTKRPLRFARGGVALVGLLPSVYRLYPLFTADHSLRHSASHSHLLQERHEHQVHRAFHHGERALCEREAGAGERLCFRVHNRAVLVELAEKFRRVIKERRH